MRTFSAAINIGVLLTGVTTACADTGRFAPDNPWFRDFERECRIDETVADDCQGSVIGAFKEESGAQDVTCDFSEFWRARDRRAADRFLPVLPWQYGVEILVAEEGVCKINAGPSPPTTVQKISPETVVPDSAKPAVSDDATQLFSRGAPYEFLFVRDGVVSLTMDHAEVSFSARFDRAALAAALPGYDLEFQDEVEGSNQFIVSRAGKDYLAVRGDLRSGKIVAIWATDGVVDANGARWGMALTAVYQSRTARCSGGLVYGCDSEVSPSLSYEVEWDEECPVQFHDWIVDEQETTILACMKVVGFELYSPE